MASTSETGHAKTVANFKKLIAFIRSYGTNYNPSKNALKLPQLESLSLLAESRITDVIGKKTLYNNKVNERQLSFADLKTLSTRLLSALKSSEATEKMIDDAKGFNRKIQGKRASPIVTISTEENIIVPNTISTSQQSYIQQIQHFAGLVSILENEPSYIPNEMELQIATLVAKQNDLATKNDEVDTAFINISNARIARNGILYNNPDNIVDVAQDIKNYIKSLFGTSSPEYAQLKGLTFRKMKN